MEIGGPKENWWIPANLAANSTLEGTVEFVEKRNVKGQVWPVLHINSSGEEFLVSGWAITSDQKIDENALKGATVSLTKLRSNRCKMFVQPKIAQEDI